MWQNNLREKKRSLDEDKFNKMKVQFSAITLQSHLNSMRLKHKRKSRGIEVLTIL